MCTDIIPYVKICPMYQVMKSDNRAKAGPLQTLEITRRKWEHLTTDMVNDLPKSNGITAVAVFMDWMAKMVHFAPFKKAITVSEYSNLFGDHDFCLHGLPIVIYLIGIHGFSVHPAILFLNCWARISHSVQRFIRSQIDSQRV